VLAGVKPNEQRERALRVGQMLAGAQQFGDPLAGKSEDARQPGAFTASVEVGEDTRREGVPHGRPGTGP